MTEIQNGKKLAGSPPAEWVVFVSDFEFPRWWGSGYKWRHLLNIHLPGCCADDLVNKTAPVQNQAGGRTHDLVLGGGGRILGDIRTTYPNLAFPIGSQLVNNRTAYRAGATGGGDTLQKDREWRFQYLGVEIHIGYRNSPWGQHIFGLKSGMTFPARRPRIQFFDGNPVFPPALSASQDKWRCFRQGFAAFTAFRFFTGFFDRDFVSGVTGRADDYVVHLKRPHEISHQVQIGMSGIAL